MTPDETRAVLRRYSGMWRYTPVAGEVAEWERALRPYTTSAVHAVLEELADAGFDRPRIVDVTRRLREPPKPQPVPPPPQWDGPTDNGRARIAAIRTSLAATPTTDELWNRRRLRETEQ